MHSHKMIDFIIWWFQCCDKWMKNEHFNCTMRHKSFWTLSSEKSIKTMQSKYFLCALLTFTHTHNTKNHFLWLNILFWKPPISPLNDCPDFNIWFSYQFVYFCWFASSPQIRSEFWQFEKQNEKKYKTFMLPKKYIINN